MIKYIYDKCKDEVEEDEGTYINLDTSSDLYYLLCDRCWRQVEEFIEKNGSMLNMKQGCVKSEVTE